ncbi:ATP-binding protein [Cryptosporangium phraense]|uniref:ATP-binding protein n=1 Tax=Cryptosporangium phraense TaxID=2593070 RepID=A0A545AZM4_9ACTN|nr:ATP-binding protein [Cryptosporangium phraense]TQS46759.1 ATP-binding protein [Cryptosporangium phraense]
MSGQIEITLVPLGDPQQLKDRILLVEMDEPELTLGGLLTDSPALSLAPLEPEHLEIPVRRLRLSVVAPSAGTPVYRPPDLAPLRVDGDVPADATRPRPTDTPGAPSTPGVPSTPGTPGTDVPLGAVIVAGVDHPAELSDRDAVLLAHDLEITAAAGYLERGLSVLVRCEKLLVEHLAEDIVGRSGRDAVHVRAAATEQPAGPFGMSADRRTMLLAALQQAVADAKPQDVLVVRHLDLLAGGTDATLTAEARELTDVLYDRSDRVLLAFVDPSLVVPEVLANRFDVRLAIDILPRVLPAADGSTVPVGRALITRDEAERFAGFDDGGLYKHVAGLNAVRLRHALRFAHHQYREQADEGRRPSFADLLHELRVFKARTSSAFEVPTVPFDAIGGYDDVKTELIRALTIINGAPDLPVHLQHDLVPRGFIFHGPPGTGKTLFAKAIAARLDATILVVSGPEITDMYVGESERKIRELFSEARRNAPSVVVFDEFDSIAASRTGRDDGGSRAGNAIVAQLLTELDGFRPEVPVLIVGTTNRIDLIDEALLRPSRFRPIKIDLPNSRAREEIVRVHAQHFDVPVSKKLTGAIARATEGMNGDEIRSIFRDARADELVGDPKRPADARRLGELVGELRRGKQQRDVDRRQPLGSPGERRGRTTLVLPASALGSLGDLAGLTGQGETSLAAEGVASAAAADELAEALRPLSTQTTAALGEGDQ